jgi:hypothetical protein
VFPAILLAEDNPPANPKGDLNALPLEASVGEVLAVDEPERGRLALGCGKYPSVRCSDLEDDIIDYSATKSLSYLAREMVGNVFECIVLRHTQSYRVRSAGSLIVKRGTIYGLRQTRRVRIFRVGEGTRRRKLVNSSFDGPRDGRRVEAVEKTGIADEV